MNRHFRALARRLGTGVARLLALLVAGTASAAQVEVAFVQPDRYTDAAPRGWIATDADRQHVLAQIRGHLAQLGARHLRPDDRLVIEVLDIDLAGRMEPFRRTGDDARFLRDITWPRMHVRYTLHRDGREDAAEAQISDMNYLLNRQQCRLGEALCYEKLMLSRWFERRFTATAAAASRR